ncbi:MAG TPA: hypothetical protein VLC09_16375, partial [Polyangiaceae bacterium]|nr:hypothetical protein [Polyangiaceae bacterium]
VQNETQATALLRCRMSELETELMIKGFSLTDQLDEGDCCLDEDTPGFDCAWKIETIELPQPAMMSGNKQDAMKDATKGLGSAASSASASLKAGGTPPPLSTSAMGNTGALGALASIEESKGATLGANAKPQDLASSFAAAQPSGPAGMATLAMSLVYPSLKPMLEASIRKVTVTVNWKEGTREQKFTVVQYITNPMKGNLNPNAAAGIGAMGAALGVDTTGAASGSGTTGSSTPSTPAGSPR